MKVEHVDTFLEVFSTKGVEKRAQHGSKGATIFRDPTEEGRLWVLLDIDEAGFQSFRSDPDLADIMAAAGYVERPRTVDLLGQYRA